MALHDYIATREKIIGLLQEKGRTKEFLIEQVLSPGENEDDVEHLLNEMKDVDKTIYQYFAYIHLNTPDSTERMQEARSRRVVNNEANPWVWYASLPESGELRRLLRNSITQDEGQVLKAVGKIVLNERRDRIGSRISRPMTEEEGRYIARINEQLRAFIEKREE